MTAAVRLDADWRYVEVNPEAAALLGRDDLVGQNVWACYPGLRGTLLGSAMEMAMETGHQHSIRTHLLGVIDDDRDVIATMHPDRRGEGGLVIQFRYVTRARPPAGDRFGALVTAGTALLG